MLLHEALHLVFATFSRQVLQQGRLTAYLADCGVFDTFDDRRTICLTIDHRYGARLYACLSHSPYKEQFDAIAAEVQQLHPTIDPQQVDYVFQSIRFAWGKIKSVRPPKPPVLFAPPKKKRPSRRLSPHRPLASSPKQQRGAGGRPTSPKKRQRRTPVSTPYTRHPTPHPKAKRPKARHPVAKRPIATRPKARRPASTPYTLHPTPKQQIHWKLLFKSIGFAILQILLYVVLVQCLIGGFIFLTEGRWYGLIGIVIGVILLYVLYRKHNP